VDGRALDRLHAVDLADHLVKEGEAAELPVGHHVEPDALLHRDGLVDGAVLDLLELRRAELARGVGVAGIGQVLGPEQ